jgi:hypothetical protein
MLYLKRKSDGKEFPVSKRKTHFNGIITLNFIWCEIGKITLPSDEYELIFKQEQKDLA